MRTFQFIVYKKLLGVFHLCEHFNSLFTRSYQVCFFYANISIHCLQEVIRCVSSMRTFQFIVYKKLLGVFLLCEHFNSLFTRSYQVCFFYANISHCLQEVIRCVSSMRTFQFIVYKKLLGVFLLCEHFNSLFLIRCVPSMRTFQFIVYKKLLGVFLLCIHFNSLFTRSYQVCFFYANISIHCLQEVIRCVSFMRTFQFIVYKKLLGVFLLCEHFNSLFTRSYQVCFFYANISIHCLQEVIRCVSSMRTFQFIVYKKLLGVFLLCEHFNTLFTRSYQVCFFYANISIHCLQEVIRCVSSMRTFQFIVYKNQVCFFYADISIHCLQEVIRCVPSMRTFQFIVYKKLLGVFLLCIHFTSLTRSYQAFQFIVYKKLLGVFLLCEHFNSLFTRSYQVCFFYANISIHCLQEVIRCVSSMRTFQFIVYKKLSGVFLLCEHFDSLFTRSYQVCFFYANLSIHCLQEVIRCVSFMRTFQFIVYKKLLGVFLLCEHFNSLCVPRQEVIRCVSSMHTFHFVVYEVIRHVSSMRTFQFIVYKKLLGVFLLCEHFNSLFTRSYQVCFFYANISIHCLQEVIRLFLLCEHFDSLFTRSYQVCFFYANNSLFTRSYQVCFIYANIQFIVYKKLLGVFLLCEHFNSLFTRSYQVCFFYANISIHCLQEVIRCVSSMRTFQFIVYKKLLGVFLHAYISIRCLQEVIRCVSSMQTFQFIVYKKLLGVFLLCEHFNSLFTRSYQVCFFYANISIHCLQEVIRCVSSMRTFQFIVYKKLLGVFLLCEHFNSLFTRSYQVCFFYANISIHCLQEVIRCVPSMRTFQFIVYKKLLGVFLLREHFNSLFTRSYQVCFFNAYISIRCLQEVIMHVSSMRIFQFIVYKKLLGVFLLCEHFNSLFTRSYQVCFFYANISIHCLQEVIRCVSSMRTFQFIVYKKLLGVFHLCEHFHCLQEVIRCVSSMRTFQFIVSKKLLGVFLLCEHFNSLFTRSYQVCFFYANISIHCLQEVIRCVSSMRTFQFIVYKKLLGVFLLCEHFNSLFTRSYQVLGVFLLCEHFNSLFTRSYQVCFFYANISIHCLQEVIRCVSFYANISIHCLQEVIRCVSSMRTFQFIVYKKLLGVFLLCEHFNSLFTRSYQVCFFYANISIHCLQEVIRCVSSMRTFQFIVYKKLSGVFLLCEHFDSLFTRSYQVCFFYANLSISIHLCEHCLQEVIRCVSSMRTFQFIVYKKLLGVFHCEHFISLFTRSYQVCFFYANISIHCLQEVIRCVSSMRTFQYIVYKKLLGVFLLCEHFNSLFTRSYQVSFFYANISIHCLQEVIRCVSSMRTFQFIVYKKLLGVFLLCEHFNSLFTRSYQVCFFYAYISLRCLQEVISVSSMRTFQFIVYKKLLGVFHLCEHFNSLFTRSYQVCFFYANISIHCLQEVIRCVSSMRTFQFIVYKKLLGVFLLCEHFNSLFTRSYQVCFFYANISIHCLQEVIRCVSSMRTFQFIVYKKLLGVFLLCEHFNSLFTRSYQVCFFYANISIHCLQEVIRCVSSMRTFQFIVYKKLLGVFHISIRCLQEVIRHFLLCEHFNSLFTRSYQVCFFYANISIHCLQEVIRCVSSMRTFQFIVYKKLLGVFLLCEHFNSLFTRSYQVCFFYANISIHCLQEVIRCVSSMRTFQFIVYKKLLGVFLSIHCLQEVIRCLSSMRTFQFIVYKKLLGVFLLCDISHCLQEVIRCVANISIHCLQEVIRCVSSMHTFQFVVYKKLLGMFLLCEHFNSLFTRSYQVCFFYANISIHCLQEVIRCVSSMRTFQFIVYKKLLGVFLLCEHFNSLFTRSYQVCFFQVCFFFYANISIHCLQEVIRCVSSMRTFQFIVYKKLLGVFLLCEHFNSLFTRSYQVCFFYANISIHCLQEVIRCVSSMHTFQFVVYKKLFGMFLLCEHFNSLFIIRCVSSMQHFNSLFTRSYQVCFFYANISIHCLQEVIRCVSSMRTFQFIVYKKLLGVFLLCEHFNSLFTRSYRCLSSMRTFQFIVYKKLLGVFLLCEHFNSLFTRSYQVCSFYANISIHCLQEVIRCVSAMRTFQFIVYKKLLGVFLQCMQEHVSSMRTFQFIVYKKLLGVFLLCEHFNSLFTRSYQVCFFYANISIHCLQEVIRCVSSMRTFQFIVYKKLLGVFHSNIPIHCLQEVIRCVSSMRTFQFIVSKKLLGVFLLCEHFNSLFTRSYQVCFFYANISIHCLQEVIRCVSSMRTFQYIVYKKLLGVFLLCEHFNSLFTRSYQVCFFYANISIHCLQDVIMCVYSMRTFQFIVYKKLLGVFLLCEHFNSLFTRSYQVCFFYAYISIRCLQEVIRHVSSMRTFQFIVYKKLLGVFLLCEHFNSLFTRSYQVCFFYANISIHCLQEVIRCVSSMRTFQFIVYKKLLGVFLLCEHFDSLFTRSYQVCFFYANLSIHCLQEVIRCVSFMRTFQFIVYKKLLGVFLLCEHFNSLFTRSYQVCFFYANISIHCLQEVIRCVSSMRTFQFIVYKKLLGVFLLCEHFNSLFTRSYQVCISSMRTIHCLQEVIRCFYLCEHFNSLFTRSYQVCFFNANISIHCLQEVIRCVSFMRTFQFIVYKKLLGVFLLCEHFNSLFPRSYQVCFFYANISIHCLKKLLGVFLYANISIHCLQEVIRCVSSMRTFQFIVYKKLLGVFLLCEHFNSLFTRSYQVCFFYANISIHCLQEVIRCVPSMRTFQFIVYKKLLGVFLLHANISIHCLQEVIRCVSSMRTFQFIVYKKLLGVFLLCEHFNSLFTRSYQVCFFLLCEHFMRTFHCLQEVIRCVSSMRTFQFIVYKKLLGVFLLCEHFNSLFTRSYQVCSFYANISIHCLQEVIRCVSSMRYISIHCLQEVIRHVSSMRTFQFIVYKKLLGVFLLCEHFNSLFTRSYQVCFFYANISIHCLQEVIRCVSSMRTFQFIVYKKLSGVFLLCEHFDSLFTRSYQVCFFYANLSIHGEHFNSLFTRSYQVCFFYANISIHCLQEVIRCVSSMLSIHCFEVIRCVSCEHFNSLFTRSYQVCFFNAYISIRCLQEVIRHGEHVSYQVMQTFQFIVYKKLLGVFLLCEHFNSLFTRSYQVCFFYANISIHCLQEVIRCVSSMRTFQFIVYKKLQVSFFYANISIHCLQEVIRCVSSMRTFQFIVYKKLLGVFLLCEHFNSLFTRSYQVCFFYANISIHCLQEVIRCVSSMHTFQFVVYKKLLCMFLLCEHFNSLFTRSYQVCFFYANISIHCLQEVIRCVSSMRTFRGSYQVCFFYANIHCLQLLGVFHCLQEVIRCVSSMRTFQFIVSKKLLGVFLLCEHFISLFTRSYQVCFFYANISIHCLQEVIRCVSSMRTFQYIVYKKLLGVFLLCEHFNSLFTRSYQVSFFYANISIHCLQDVIRCVSSMRTFQFIVYKKLLGVFLLCEHFNSLFTRSYQVCFLYAYISLRCLQEVIRHVSSMRTFQFIVYKKLLGVFLLCEHFNSLFTRSYQVCFFYANISIHCLQEVICVSSRCVSGCFYANISIHCLQEVIRCVSSMRTFQFIVYKKLLGVFHLCEHSNSLFTRSYQVCFFYANISIHCFQEVIRCLSSMRTFNSLFPRSYQVCFFYANISIHCLQEVIRCVSSMRTFQFIVYKKLLGVFLLCEHFNSLFTRSYQVCFFYANISIHCLQEVIRCVSFYANISIHCFQEVIRCVSSMRTFHFIVYKKLLGVFLLCEHFNSLFTRSYQVCFFYANISIHCLQEVIRCVSSMRTFQFIVYKKLLGVFLLCEHFNSLFTRSYQVCFFYAIFNSLFTRSYQVCFLYAYISLRCLQEVIRHVSSMRTFQFIVYKKLLGVFLLCEHFNSLFTRSYQVCFFYANISIHCLQEVIRCVSSMRTFQFIVYKKLSGVFLLCEHFDSLFTRSYQVCFFYANLSIHQEVIRCVSFMRTFQYKKLLGVFLLCEHFNSLFTRRYQVCFFYADISFHCFQEVIRCVPSMRTFQFIVYKKLLGVFPLCIHFTSLFTRSYQACFFYANISIHCLQEVIRCVSSMRTFQFIVYKKLLGVFLLCEHFNSLFTRSYKVCFFYANISIHCLQEVIRCVSSMRTFRFIVYKKLLGVFLLCEPFNSLFTRSYQVCFIYANIPIRCLQEVIRCVSSMRTFQFIVSKKLLGVFLLCEHFNSLFPRSYQVCFFYANISIHCLQEVIRCVSSMHTFQFVVYKKLFGMFLLCEHLNSLFTRSYQVCFFNANISIHCLQEVIRCVSSMRTFQFIVYKKLLGVFLLCEHFNTLFTRSYQVCFFYANISIHCLQEVTRCLSSMRTFQFIVCKKLLGVFLLCEHFNSLFTRSYQVCSFYANISIHCLQEVIRCVSFQFIVYKKLLGVFLQCIHFNSLFTRSYYACFFYANISIHCLQEVIRCVSSMRTFQFIVYKKLSGVFLLCEHFDSLFTRSYQVCFFYANLSIHCLQEVIRCVSFMRTFQFIVYKKLLGVFLLCEHFNSLFPRSYQVCFFYANISFHCLQEVIRCVSSMRTFQFIVYKKVLGVFLLCEHFNTLFTRSYQVCFFYANISIHSLQEVIRCLSSMRTFQFIVYKTLLGVFLLCGTFQFIVYKKLLGVLFTRSYQASMRTFQFIVYKKLLGVFLLCIHFNSLFTRSYQASFFYANISIHCLQEVIRCVSSMRTFQFIVYKKLLGVFLLCEHFNSLFTRSYKVCFFYANISIHCLQEVIRCVSSMRTFRFIVYKKLLGVFLLCEPFNSLFTRSYQVCFIYANIPIHCLQEVIRCVSSMRTFQFIVSKKLLGVFLYANISFHCLQEVIRCVSSMRTFQFIVYKKLLGVFLLCEHFNTLFTRSYQVCSFYANISIHCLQEVIRCLSSMRTFQFIVYKTLLGVFLLCGHFNSLFTRSYQVCSFYANISIHCLQEVIRCVSSMHTFHFVVYKKLLGMFLLCEHFNSLFTRSYQVCFFYANISIHCLQEVIRCVSSMRTFQFIVYKKLLGVFLLCEHFNSLFTRSYQVCFFYANISIHCLQEVIRCVSSMRTFQFIVYKKLLGVFLLCEHFNSLFTRSYQVCFFYANISIHCLQEVIRCVSSMRTFQFIVSKKLLGVFLLCEHFNSLFTRSYQVCFFYAYISIRCLQEVIRHVSSMRTFQFIVYKKLLGVFLLCEHFNSLFTRSYQVCFFYANISIHCLQEVIRCVSSMRTFQFIVYKKLSGVFLLCEHFDSLFTRSYQVCFFYANISIHCLQEVIRCVPSMRTFYANISIHCLQEVMRSLQVCFFYANISIHCLQEVIRHVSSMFLLCEHFNSLFTRSYQVCFFYANKFIVYKKLLGVFLLCEHFNSLFTSLQEVIRCVSSMRTFQFIVYKKLLGVFLLCEHFNSLFTRSYQVCFFYANISIHCFQEVIRCVSSMRTFQFIVYKKLLGVFLLCEHFNSLFTRSYQACFFYANIFLLWCVFFNANISIHCLQEVIRCVSSMRTFQFIVYKKLLGVFLLCEHFNSLFTEVIRCVSSMRTFQFIVYKKLLGVFFYANISIHCLQEVIRCVSFYANISIHCLQEVIRCVPSMRTFQFIVYKKLLGVFLLCEHFNSLFTRSYQVCFFNAYISIRCLQEVIMHVSSMRTFQFIVYKKLLGVFLQCKHFNSLFTRSYQVCFFYALFNISIHCLQEVIRCVSSMRTFQFIVYKKLLGVFLLCEHFNSLFTRSYQVCFFYANISIHCLQEVIRCVSSMRTFQFIVYKKLLGVFLLCEHFNSLFTRSYQVCLFYANISSMRTFQFIVYKKLLGVFLLCEHFNSLFTRSYQVCFFYANISIHCLQEVIRCFYQVLCEHFNSLFTRSYQVCFFYAYISLRCLQEVIRHFFYANISIHCLQEVIRCVSSMRTFQFIVYKKLLGVFLLCEHFNSLFTRSYQVCFFYANISIHCLQEVIRCVSSMRTFRFHCLQEVIRCVSSMRTFQFIVYKKLLGVFLLCEHFNSLFTRSYQVCFFYANISIHCLQEVIRCVSSMRTFQFIVYKTLLGVFLLCGHFNSLFTRSYQVCFFYANISIHCLQEVIRCVSSMRTFQFIVYKKLLGVFLLCEHFNSLFTRSYQVCFFYANISIHCLQEVIRCVPSMRTFLHCLCCYANISIHCLQEVIRCVSSMRTFQFIVYKKVLCMCFFYANVSIHCLQEVIRCVSSMQTFQFIVYKNLLGVFLLMRTFQFIV